DWRISLAQGTESLGCHFALSRNRPQLGALGLVTNAVVLWNTMYMQAALDHLRAQGETLNDEDIARLSPLCHGHINMLGHYSFTLAELVTKGHLRPLKEASEVENVA
ncbi:Tn3 family transposase, partial [Enterobacter hormaechei]|uniref:Tn3 family transposase n=1 Tax=Enterobacter hormaechei TaxID=158836 RepID=UPI002093926A